MESIRNKLTGNDRRSIGRSNEVVAQVLNNPALFDELFAGMLSADLILRMRCADAVEKVSVKHPEYLQPYKARLINEVACIEQHEVRWHVAQMLPRLDLNADERKAVVTILLGYLGDQSKIVKTFAMQALADLALRDSTLRPQVIERLEELPTAAAQPCKAVDVNCCVNCRCHNQKRRNQENKNNDTPAQGDTIMKRQWRWFLLLLTVVGGPLFMQRASRAQSHPDAAAIDRFISEQMTTQRIPGLALAIIQDDHVLYAKGYGAARANEPVTPQTQFILASLSKSFTAVAVMQLVEAGKIDLDAPVQRYLPTFTLADPLAAQQITVRQLLNHTSGLADAGVPDLRLARPATSAERIATLRTAHTVAAPGSEFYYTDINYQILGRMVEVVSGQTLSAYLQAHIFAPLQMAQTVNVMSSFAVAQRAEHLAQGHLLAFALPIASDEETGYLGGSSGVISTAADMAHYLIMHNDAGSFQGQQIVSPASTMVLHTPPSNLKSNYAMGWVANTINGQRLLEHNGILSTFYANMVLLPESHQGFIVLYNIHSLAQDVVGFPQIKQGLVTLLTGGQPASGGFSVGVWGMLFAVITVLSAAWEVGGLWQLPRWREQAITKPWWRLLLAISWALVPAVLVLTMPSLILRSAGRAFGYLTIFRSMVEMMVWLTVCGVLGALNGLARLAWLVQRTQQRKGTRT